MTNKNITVFFLILFCLNVTAGDNYNEKEPAYLNASIPVKQRVSDLLSRMTLAEKIAQMCQYVGLEHIKKAEKNMSIKNLRNNDANAFYPDLTIRQIESMVENGMIGSFLHVVTAKEANDLQRLAMKSRLRIPLLIGIDAIHGNGMVSGSTIYPSPIGLSCSWDTAMVKQIARNTALEMRETGSHWAFSPNLDVARDARWGRIGETYGEDPFLVSAVGVATINGLQGDGKLGSYGVLACAKHLLAGSEPVNGLNKAPTDLSERTLEEIYLPPFRCAVKAGVYSVMPAHNEVNGIPCHAHKYLMEDLLRKRWDFKGFYISDFMDIERMVEAHHSAIDQKEAVYQSVGAGMDMHMHGPGFMEPLLQLVKEGKLSEERINESASRILEAKFKLGLFEKVLISENSDKVFSEEHKQLSLKSAHKSIVLLKNNGILPLDKKRYKRILVVGPNANNQAILGDWSLEQPAGMLVTVLKGITDEVGDTGEVSYFDCGSSILDMEMNRIKEAGVNARNADLVIAVVGDNSLRFETGRTAGENIDRDDTGLPGLQQQLVEELQGSGKPMVVVLVNGRPLSIPWINEHVPAIVEAWEPGSFGGQAIAEILFGKVNPAGKLTVSIPRNAGQIHTYYNHKPSQYIRNYIGSVTGPLYDFGYGLSYTSYSYGKVSLSKNKIYAGEDTELQVEVRNIGNYTGEEIVQLYINGSVSRITKPVKELKGFRKIQLDPGEQKTVNFKITAELLTSLDGNMNRVIDPGEFKIMIGGSSADGDLKSVKLTVLANPSEKASL